jgi:hypothetical protein
MRVWGNSILEFYLDLISYTTHPRCFVKDFPGVKFTR